MIKIARVYEREGAEPGPAYLVERLWPRGIRKESLRMDAWLKDVAPSQPLRQWYAHDPDKWEEFQRRYRAELDEHPGAWQPLLDAARKGDITLLYSARDTERNSALLLKWYLDERVSQGSRE